MKGNYDIAETLVLADEGGYTNDRSDSGGPTNFGITIFDYRKYINPKGTANDVRKMSVDQAKAIYKTKYWDALGCDDLPSGVDYTCFDYGVNSGLGRPRSALRKFSNLKGVDLVNAINDERTTFLKNLAASVPKDRKFLKGWLSRVNRVRLKSEAMAKPNNVAGPVSGGSVAGASLTLSQFWHAHEVAIIVTGIVLAFVIGTAIHYFKNKGK